MTVGLGVIGCGSVFWTPYMSLIERLAGQGRVRVAAVHDADPDKQAHAAARLDLPADLPDGRAVCEHPDVDAVLVLTSMREHGPLARTALEAGRHVLVEKPVATTLAEAEAVLAAAEAAPGHLVCAPHMLLSPTYRAMHARVVAGEVGDLLTARARYGWAGPDWGRWYYEPGGGALFDLGIYNVTSLCGFFGPARRVTAMTGVAIPERVIGGETVPVRAEDNAHVLLDFGDARFAVVTTGFTMQRYRSPCLELYGTHGVLQMLGDDWAPEGHELWRNDRAAWELHPETEPAWPWTDGLRHLVECIETGAAPVTRPEHAFHALEIMLAAQAAGADGRARTITSPFPAPDLARLEARPGAAAHRVHDPAERRVSHVERPALPASSPRPAFPGPALIRRADVTRHVWGDPAAGEVFDWIYASTERVHMLVFGLPPGGAFRHSEDFRTVFAADELLHVLEGTLVIADPETGEVQRAAAGEQVFFRRDTWHHAFALGPEPLRVLELFAPPPAAGASSGYARRQPYLEESRYADDALLGHWPGSEPARPRLRVLRPADVLWRRDLGVLCGILVSTEHLTVATLEIGPGEVAAVHEHGGDEVLMALSGTLWVRAWHEGAVHVFELGPEDACYLPRGSAHEYRNPGAGTARAICGIAPAYLP